MVYELEEKAKNEGIEIGIEIGEEKGVRKGKIEMAKELKQRNVDMSIIVKASGLSEDEIVKL